MNKNKYFLYLLLCGLLLYYAIPHLPLHGEGPGVLFSFAWLTLLLFAIAGNMARLLFSPRKNAVRKKVVSVKVKKGVSSRQYLRGS